MTEVSAGTSLVAQVAARTTEQVSSVIIGKEEQVNLLLVALLSEGHVLIDDVPGVAKTLLAKTLAAALGLRFARVQCTPDLLPADVTGSEVFNLKTGEFEFRPGPIFANVVLVDEINRATPRTQSSFLEAMEERQVTVEGQSHDAAAAVHRAGHAEPGRAQGHVPAARGAARPLSHAAAPRLSERRGGGARARALPLRGPARGGGPRDLGGGARAGARRGAGGVREPGRGALHRGHRARHP